MVVLWYVSPWPKEQNTGDGQDVLEVIHRFEHVEHVEHVEHAAPWCWRVSLVEMGMSENGVYPQL